MTTGSHYSKGCLQTEDLNTLGRSKSPAEHQNSIHGGLLDAADHHKYHEVELSE